jgi:DNA processing protein
MTAFHSAADRALAWVLAFPDGGRASRQRGREFLAGDTPAGHDEAIAAGRERIASVRDALQRLGWRFVPAGAGEIPAGIAALSDPPLGLFVKGEMPSGPAAALVGARQASSYGREVAEYLATGLARAGVTVVSGMARGVDAAAHRGALASGGRTVAVWGAGVDRIYPPEHAGLAAEIASSGTLVTEYPPGSPPLPHHFPERNRILAGLAHVVVVVEASERSGALITARQALEEGRDVMAVPGSIFSRLSAGPNGLLRAGAAPAVTADDILGVLGLPPSTPQGELEDSSLLGLLQGGESRSVDELAAGARLPVAAVLEELLRLELAGAVIRETDGRYRRNRAGRV